MLHSLHSCSSGLLLVEDCQVRLCIKTFSLSKGQSRSTFKRYYPVCLLKYRFLSASSIDGKGPPLGQQSVTIKEWKQTNTEHWWRPEDNIWDEFVLRKRWCGKVTPTMEVSVVQEPWSTWRTFERLSRRSWDQIQTPQKSLFSSIFFLILKWTTVVYQRSYIFALPLPQPSKCHNAFPKARLMNKSAKHDWHFTSFSIPPPRLFPPLWLWLLISSDISLFVQIMLTISLHLFLSFFSWF